MAQAQAGLPSRLSHGSERDRQRGPCPDCGQGGELRAALSTYKALTFAVLRMGHVGTSHSGGPKSALPSTAALAKFSLMMSRAQSSRMEPTLRLLCVLDSKAVSTENSPQPPTGQKAVFMRALHMWRISEHSF